MTAELPILNIPSLYRNSLWIIEIGRPWLSTAHPSVVMKAEMICWANRSYLNSKQRKQGCSLKRFLHVPQEAAGGYHNRGSSSALPDILPLLFYTEKPPNLVSRYSAIPSEVHRSGLKKSRQLVSKRSCLHLVIIPFHPMWGWGVFQVLINIAININRL